MIAFNTTVIQIDIMKSSAIIILIIFWIFFTMNCIAQVQDNYSANINLAKQLEENKEYIKAAQVYTKAFVANHNLGRVDHRYAAARCWTLGGMIDSAFFQLEKIVKGNFSQYLQIKIDTAFTSLHTDIRWSKILELVRINREKTNKLRNSEFKNLNQSLVEILDTVYLNDQLPRLEIQEIEQKYGWSSAQVIIQNDVIMKLDVINRDKVKAILDRYGWLGKEDVGEQGSTTLFLVIQHSDLATQLQYLPMIERATKEGKVAAADLALLQDRVALAQGKKQTYGSQIQRNQSTGKYFVRPLIDPENVNKRRKEVGLSTIEEYVKQWGISWSTEQYRRNLKENSLQ